MRFWLSLINIAIAIWIYFDGKKRGINVIFWSAGALFTILFFPLYLIFRPKGRLINCMHCGKKKLGNINCPFCHESVGVSVVCPNCEALNPPGSLNCLKCKRKI
ncbi:MAG: hypothetical protein QMD92_06035 [bacterium]|nr:hypothetical protein [bacterium]